MYSSYSFSTSALDGGEWSASRPGRSVSAAAHSEPWSLPRLLSIGPDAVFFVSNV
jgi:hypothetical protein